MNTSRISIAIPILALAASPARAQVRLNEVYVSMFGPDNKEFIEITGPAGMSLANYMVLIVTGDGPNIGVLDRAWDLSAFAIPASGYFVMGDTGLFPTPEFDLGAQDEIPNQPETIYLVRAFDPLLIQFYVGLDVRFPGPGTVIHDLCWDVDAVGIVDAGYPATVAVFDGAPVAGPDGTQIPAGVARCGDIASQWSPIFLDFDGLPTAGYHFASRGVANAPCYPGGPICAGDGSGVPCPCANESASGSNAGCLSSIGTGGSIAATGLASLSADTVVLSGTHMPNSSTLFFQGSARVNGGLGIAFGDGLRCVAGSVVRLGTKLNVAGASQYPDAGDLPVSIRGAITTPGSQRVYQCWYRNAATFCTPATFNLTNAWVIVWDA